MTLEKVATPRSKVDIQSRSRHLISVAGVAGIRQSVSQAPGLSSHLVPRQLHPCLNGTVAEINHNESLIIVLDPAPGDQVLKAWIVGPSAKLAQLPFRS